MDPEQALLGSAAWDFWAKKARENGMTNTEALYAEKLAARRDLATIFGDPIPDPRAHITLCEHSWNLLAFASNG